MNFVSEVTPNQKGTAYFSNWKLKSRSRGKNCQRLPSKRLTQTKNLHWFSQHQAPLLKSFSAKTPETIPATSTLIRRSHLVGHSCVLMNHWRMKRMRILVKRGQNRLGLSVSFQSNLLKINLRIETIARLLSPMEFKIFRLGAVTISRVTQAKLQNACLRPRKG